jgi:hypothetical protein
LIESFERWKSELLLVGNIVQDADLTVPRVEAARRFDRYIELLQLLKGTEGREYALAVIESIQARYDYGAYAEALRAAWRFGEEIYCSVLIDQLPRLISGVPDRAGEVLVSIANGQGTRHQSVIRTFNRLLVGDKNEFLIRRFIASEETGGWLSNRVGVMGKTS